MHHYFILKYGAGFATNNRAKFYALWILLKTVANKSTNQLQVLGDSKLFMDWAKSKCQITNLALETIINRVLEAKTHFEFIAFTHIFKEFNSK